jgi:hypothetical protein
MTGRSIARPRFARRHRARARTRARRRLQIRRQGADASRLEAPRPHPTPARVPVSHLEARSAGVGPCPRHLRHCPQSECLGAARALRPMSARQSSARSDPLRAPALRERSAARRRRVRRSRRTNGRRGSSDPSRVGRRKWNEPPRAVRYVRRLLVRRRSSARRRAEPRVPSVVLHPPVGPARAEGKREAAAIADRPAACRTL